MFQFGFREKNAIISLLQRVNQKLNSGNIVIDVLCDL